MQRGSTKTYAVKKKQRMFERWFHWKARSTLRFVLSLFTNHHIHKQLNHTQSPTLPTKYKFTTLTKLQTLQDSHIHEITTWRVHNECTICDFTISHYRNEHGNRNLAVIIFITISKMHTNRTYHDFAKNENGRFCKRHKKITILTKSYCSQYS